MAFPFFWSAQIIIITNPDGWMVVVVGSNHGLKIVILSTSTRPGTESRFQIPDFSKVDNFHDLKRSLPDGKPCTDRLLDTIRVDEVSYSCVQLVRTVQTQVAWSLAGFWAWGIGPIPQKISELSSGKKLR